MLRAARRDEPRREQALTGVLRALVLRTRAGGGLCTWGRRLLPRGGLRSVRGPALLKYFFSVLSVIVRVALPSRVQESIPVPEIITLLGLFVPLRFLVSSLFVFSICNVFRFWSSSFSSLSLCACAHWVERHDSSIARPVPKTDL